MKNLWVVNITDNNNELLKLVMSIQKSIKFYDEAVTRLDSGDSLDEALLVSYIKDLKKITKIFEELESE